MVSGHLYDAVVDDSDAYPGTGRSVMRWIVALAILGAIGWTWPYDLDGVPDRISDTSWLFSWLTVLVLIGAAAGYVLRSRWSMPLVVLGLYAGGAIRWFQDVWGFREPEWEGFLTVSAIAAGVLLVSSGFPAGIACRVLEAERTADGQPRGSVQLASAVAGLMGLLAFTAINVLPLPYIGGFLGLAALLAGITVMQESHASGREHLLAIVGMIFGVIAAGTQAWELWDIVRDL